MQSTAGTDKYVVQQATQGAPRVWLRGGPAAAGATRAGVPGPAVTHAFAVLHGCL